MRKINLVYIITKLELGGAQKQLLSLIRQLDREKFNVFLFTAREGLMMQDALSIPDLTLNKSRCLERAINPLKDILAFIEIYLFIKKNKADIVHTHSSKAGILGRLAAGFAKVNLVLHTVHGWSFNDCQRGWQRAFFIRLERLAAAFTHKIIVVSKHDKVKGLANRIGSDFQYHLIRYGINYSDFAIKDQKIKKELGIAPEDSVVTMISCLKPQKSPQDFIRLAALVTKQIPGVKFILAGDGILRLTVERLIKSLNLQNKVMPLGWRQDIPGILSSTDIFVLTSRWEGLPVSLLEAMASSCPVIVTHTGAVAEVVLEAENGFLVPPGNMHVMSERLIGLLKDKNIRQAIGRSARKSLDYNFSVEGMVNNTQGLYRNLISTKLPWPC